MTKKEKQLVKYIVSISIALIGLFIYQRRFREDMILVDFLDVGQGDAILIHLSSEYQVLIDGGPSDAVLSQLQEVMPFADSTIEWVILSHPDADHLAGLTDVLKNYDVGLITVPDVEKDNQLIRLWEQLIELHQIPYQVMTEESSICVFTDACFHFADSPGGDEVTANNASLVFELNAYGQEFLFTGDIEEETEDMLNDYWGDVDVLKVAHHGSRTSSSSTFLDAVDAEYAVIMAGRDNTFGHPHEITLSRLSSRNVQVFQTNELGRVRIGASPEALWVEQPIVPLFEGFIGKRVFLR